MTKKRQDFINTGQNIAQETKTEVLIRGLHVVSVFSFGSLNLGVIEHEFILIFLQELSGPLFVQKQGVDLGREQFEIKLEQCETAILRLTNMPLEAFERHWAIFQFEGQPFKARYFVFGDITKPTLVMTHGYGTYALGRFTIFKDIS